MIRRGTKGMSMRRLVIDVAVQAAAAGLAVVAMAAPALAAGNHGDGSGSVSAVTGNDISYPQCGGAFPPSPAFGIVGVNAGLANGLNPCLGPSSSYPSYNQAELYWAAAASTGMASQPKASLYVNTADPGNLYKGTPIADWPTSGTTPYGTCKTTTVTTSHGTFTVGRNTRACAWQYGHNKAAQDVSWITTAAQAINAQNPPVTVAATAGSYPWWLDAETQNSWRTGTSGQAMNVADLQGMIAALRHAGASSVGAYSTSSQWNAITGGTTSASGTLYRIPDWIPGAKTLSGAKSNCRLASFTSGHVVITQWTGTPDHDHAC
jgi:hypothetical protein